MFRGRPEQLQGRGQWRGEGERQYANVSLGAEPNSLYTNGGTALMVHAAADDMKSYPAGSAGARIACGVISK